MVDVSPAEEARKGLLASVTGKAKEVAGAVLGNDSLAAEGQLQQAEAAARKDASLQDAVAQAAERSGEAVAAARVEQVERDAALESVKASAAAERQEVVDIAAAER